MQIVQGCFIPTPVLPITLHIPVIIMIMMVKGYNLVQALMTTNLIALIIFIALGYGSVNAICGSSGVVASGMTLSKTDRMIADYILDHSSTVGFQT